jgi:hypothetical protein
MEFSENHGYANGQILSFRIPSEFGAKQFNGKQARIISHSDTTVTLDLESTNFDPFVFPAVSEQPDPFSVPVASGILQSSPVPQTNLECSFDHRQTT